MRLKNRTLEISNQNEVYYLQPETILYVVADGNYCDIHLTDGDVLETVGFQRAEIARRIDTQLSRDLARRFALVGKPYLVNVERIMYINATKQQLVFDVNHPGTCRKKSLKASTGALRALRQALDNNGVEASKDEPIASTVRINGGFSNYLASQATERSYDIEDDEVMVLGR